MDGGVCTQEVICRECNYQENLGESFLKGVKRIDKNLGGEDQVEYCIPLVARRLSYLNPTADIYVIAAIRSRFYADGREAELET